MIDGLILASQQKNMIHYRVGSIFRVALELYPKRPKKLKYLSIDDIFIYLFVGINEHEYIHALIAKLEGDEASNQLDDIDYGFIRW